MRLRFWHSVLSFLLIAALLSSSVSVEWFHDHEEEVCTESHSPEIVDSCHLTIYHGQEFGAKCKDHDHLVESELPCFACSILPLPKQTAALTEYQALAVSNQTDIQSSWKSIIIPNRNLESSHNKGPPAVV